MAEAAFSLRKITYDIAKYNHVIVNLDETTLETIWDLIEHPPALDKYLTIKNRIISDY